MNGSTEPKYPLHTLTKALGILDCISSHAGADGMTLSSLSKALNMSKSSVHRILDTLLYHGFVDKTGGPIVYYKLGWRLYHIGQSVPAMHEFGQEIYEDMILRLSADLGHQISVFVEENAAAVSVYEAYNGSRVIPGGIFDNRLPLYASAAGKLFMLNYTEEEILNYFRNTEVRRHTSSTILNYIEFLEELKTVERNGYAADHQEYMANWYSIAVPVRNYTGRIIAVIAASGKEAFSDARKEEIHIRLSAEAKELSRYLGAE